MLFLNPSGRGDSAMVSMNSSERWYAQGKLTWRATPTVKISGNYIFDRVKSRPYSAFRTEFRDYFYNPDGFGNDYNISNAFIFQLTHALSQNSFYTVGGSVFEKKYKYYLYDDWNDPRYVHPDVLQIRYNGWSFLTGGTDLRRTYRSTTTYLGKVDINSQLTSTHLLKGGVEFRKHRAFYEYYQMKAIDAQTSLDVTNPFITTAIPPTSSPNHDWYVHNPTELSGYIQDKMEFKDMIVNVGVRYDHFQPDGVVLNDDQNTYGLPYAPNYTVDDPDIYEPIKPYNKFFDYNLNGVKDPGELDKTVDDRRGYWYKKASAKWKISPRLGVSFPITARGIVHFSYGHFFQTPRFERLYENPEFKIGSGQTVVMGNADLEPEETINGEIGVQQQLTDDISIDVTAYLRDIRGLAGTEGEQVVVFGGSAQYYKYTNSDFGFVRGIVLTLNKRFSGGFTSTLDYTFQLAKGSASDPQDARNAKAGGAQPEIQLNPLNWDQRHTLNITLTYSASNWGLSTIAQYNSGQPYTPRRTTDITALMTNSQSKPPFLNLDIRAYYEFSISPFKLVAFGRVFNLLDIRNQTDVYLDTGQAGVTIDEANARSINPLTPVNSLSQWFRVPTQYSEPRRIEIGMNLEF
jgi:hypothetical protein